MKHLVPGVLLSAILSGCAGSPAINHASANVLSGKAAMTTTHDSKPASGKTMIAFRSEQELQSYLRELAEKQKREQQSHALSAKLASSMALKSDSAMAAASPPAAPGAGGEESVTNVQQAGVDEGGIVKVHGNHLVVLRHGRLFTVAIGHGALQPVSSIDAFAPGIDPRYAWYDEMLVYEDTIAVIGYSYGRGGTEVNLFSIDPAGKLAYQSTYHLRSNDYYSSRNYASRLVGSKLIFYAPLYLSTYGDVLANFPAVRKWHKDATPDEFRRIVAAEQIYRPNRAFNLEAGAALHTVTSCDLKDGGFNCNATSVIGPPGRVFYVSQDAVYVWVSDRSYRGRATRSESILYRLPLDGSSPTALGASGSPVDQFSFLESEDRHLNVLVRSITYGEGMWGAEHASGNVALMRVPLASFSDGSDSVPQSDYRRLPTPRGNTFQNRFVGDYLLYGTGSGWGYPENAEHSILYAVRWAGDGDAYRLSLAHGTDRLEQMGRDAVVVGTDGRNLHFTAISLGSWPQVMDDYVREGASQGELRSHGFFYKPDTEDSGILGLPVRDAGQPGYSHLVEDSAAVLFVRNDSLHFRNLGELRANPERRQDDGCHASCVDWYGNARPLFVHGRLFALLGYELVEGKLEQGQIHEIARVSYAPQKLAARRHGLKKVLAAYFFSP